MSDSKVPPDVEGLSEEYDSSEAVWDAGMEDPPDLPPRIQELDEEERLDLGVQGTNGHETRQIKAWMIYRREAGNR